MRGGLKLSLSSAETQECEWKAKAGPEVTLAETLLPWAEVPPSAR